MPRTANPLSFVTSLIRLSIIHTNPAFWGSAGLVFITPKSRGLVDSYDTSMDIIRLILADSDASFRETLCQILSKERDIKVVGKSDDGEDTISLVQELISAIRMVHAGVAVFDHKVISHILSH